MPPPLFKLSDKVRVKAERDKIGVVTGLLPQINQQNWYEVFFHIGDIRNLPELGIEAAPEKADIITLLKASSFSKKETLSKLITYTKLSFPVRNNLYALGSSRTEFLAYQFVPLLKFLDSRNQKLLIADEVGLGKTIEAGLILIEMRARHDLDRVLVVCPSGLTEKWQLEMKNRFDEHLEIFDAARIRKFLKDLDQEGESTKLKAICSMQTMRNQAIMEEWEAAAPPIDLLIVDEAHHMRNPGTNSNALGRLLYETAESMVMLTATPVHLGNVDLFNLLRILDAEEFDNIDVFDNRLNANEPIVRAIHRLARPSRENLQQALADLRSLLVGPEADRFRKNPIYDEAAYNLERIEPSDYRAVVNTQRQVHQLSLLSHILTRTKKRDAQESAKRVAQIVPVIFSSEEMDFYGAMTDYVIKRAQGKTRGSFAAFAAMMPQRQVASCLPAVAENYRALVQRAVAGGIEDEEMDISLEDIANDGQDDEIDEEPIGDDPYLRVVAAANRLGSTDSKCAAFLSKINELERAEPGRKIIVFSYFKKTLSYLSRRLSADGYPNLVISGDVPAEERGSLIRRFKEDPSIRVLLSSEVGSEGLDFQFCHIIFNYDLPWNPMVVEQRIGRVDRIGQKSQRILIYNLSVQGTIEARILERLYDRIKIFEKSIGDLEAILGDEMRELTRELLTSRLTPREQEELIEAVAIRIEQRRKHTEYLEQESAKLIGHDQFFNDELTRIRENKLYLSAEAMRVFLEEFLQRNHPSCSLRSIDPEGVYRLKVNDQLRNQIRKAIPSDDRSLGRFLSGCSLGSIDVTFDNGVATERGELEFISNYHPIVRMIVRHYDEHSDELHPVSKIRLQTELVPPGPYLYFIYCIMTKAARSENVIEMVLVSHDRREVLGATVSDKLIDAIITQGETLEDEPTIDPSNVDAITRIANEQLGKEIQRIEENLRRVNTALIESQLESLKQSYAAKKGKKEIQLRTAETKNRAPQYIRMLRGGLRNLESEYQRKLSEIESKRDISVSYNSIAAGYLEARSEELK